MNTSSSSSFRIFKMLLAGIIPTHLFAAIEFSNGAKGRQDVSSCTLVPHNATHLAPVPENPEYGAAV
jgi:hypothetical protein